MGGCHDGQSSRRRLPVVEKSMFEACAQNGTCHNRYKILQAPRGLRRARGGRQSTRSRPPRQSQTRRVDAVLSLRQLCRVTSGPNAALISAADGTSVPASHRDPASKQEGRAHAGDLRPLVRSIEKGAHGTGEVLIREPAIACCHSNPITSLFCRAQAALGSTAPPCLM